MRKVKVEIIQGEAVQVVPCRETRDGIRRTRECVREPPGMPSRARPRIVGWLVPYTSSIVSTASRLASCRLHNRPFHRRRRRVFPSAETRRHSGAPVGGQSSLFSRWQPTSDRLAISIPGRISIAPRWSGFTTAFSPCCVAFRLALPPITIRRHELSGAPHPRTLAGLLII